MAEHFITFEMLRADGTPWRAKARYDQPLEVVIDQAQLDVDVNNRVAVRVEDAKGKVVWEPK